jgi:hypothetical protein
MKKFFAPLREEYKWNPHGILNIIGSLGVFPAVMLAREVDNIWILFGIVILWWLIVAFVYLVYCYFKNK